MLCAPLRHNGVGVQFFISHLARWLRTCRFSKPTFKFSTLRDSGATNHWKNRMFRAPASLFLWFFLFSLLFSLLLFSSLLWLFPPLLFHLSILSEVWLPNFLRWIWLAKPWYKIVKLAAQCLDSYYKDLKTIQISLLPRVLNFDPLPNKYPRIN